MQHNYEDIKEHFGNILDIQGIECCEGWYDILFNALKKIKNAAKNTITITHIYEHNGRLCIDYEVNYTDENTFVRVDLIDEVIEKLGNRSQRICEYCGSDKGQKHYHPWRRITCPDCENYRFGDIEERED